MKLHGLGALALGCAAMGLLTGFAPFDSAGLLRMTVAADGEAVEASPEVEAEPLFHSLSSRYGGGGVLIYSEFGPEQAGFSGLLLIDLRHAGLADLERSEVPVGDLKRVDLYYQEWDGSAQRFEGDKVEGTLSVEDLFRGELASALALRFDLTFTDAGEDGALGTDDDKTRQLVGSLVTSPTVAQVVEDEATLARSRRGSSYDPDGDVYVSCVGETDIEERPYREDSYVYEDDDGGSCTGDTWKDDGVDPQESGGCAGEETVDDGEPDPSGGCADDDEFADDEQVDDGTGEDSYYDDEGYDDGSGCADTTDDTDDTSTDDSASSDGYEDSGDCGCSGDSTDTSDSSSSDSYEDSGDCGGCEGGDSSGSGDTFDDKPGLGSGIGTGRRGSAPAWTHAPVAAACGVGMPLGAISNVQRAYLRRALAELERRPDARQARWSRAEWRQVKSAMRHLPFVMLSVGLWSLRRRKGR